MRLRQLILTVTVSFLGGFVAVAVVLNGLIPYGAAVCPGPAGQVCGNGDVNASGDIDIADAIYVLSYLFASGPAPVACADGGALTPEQEEILSYMGMVDLPDGQGGVARTLSISGVNVQLVNSIGSTETANGVGNLIVGYQKPRPEANNRTGSHNIIVGDQHDYSSHGGLVAGLMNTISGPFSSVSGGYHNTASGDGSSVSGGQGRSSTGQCHWRAGGLFEDN